MFRGKINWCRACRAPTAHPIRRLNNQGGHGVGVPVGIEFFLADLAPSLFANLS